MNDAMHLRCVIYSSEAQLGLTESDLDMIDRTATELNALDGITGLLIYNGRYFVQLLEGASEALDDVMGRISADPRHNNISVEYDYPIDRRSFPDWSMKMQAVDTNWSSAAPVFDSLMTPETLPTNAADMRAVLEAASIA